MTKHSYLFLFSLLIILVFIVGLRYGQNVEKTNKTISFMLSLPPTRPPSPQPTLSFLSYEHKGCGVRFLYPSLLDRKNESSTSAEFTTQEKRSLAFSCEKNNILFSFLSDKKNVATESVTFRNKSLIAKINEDMLVFPVQNTRNGSTVTFSMVKNLIPLLEKSLEFVN